MHLLVTNNSEVLATSLRSVRRCLRLHISIPAWPPGVVPGVGESPLVLLLPCVVVKPSDTPGVPDTTAGNEYYFHCCRILHTTLP